MLKSLINLLYPLTCNGCDALLLDSEDVVCTQCRHDMPFTQHYLNPGNETAQKFYGRLDLVHASSLVYFHKEGMVQELIHNLKYRKQEGVGRLMGQWYAPLLKQVPDLQTVTDVIPVPLHPKRFRERGYNQVTLFGQEIATGLGIPYNEDILVRANYTKTQTKKNREMRAAIINSAFAVNHTEADNGKHFLLIDDVITTGATLEACGKLLLQIPGAKLSIVTMAYAQS
ncbi:ComF family protein [Flavobacterium psychrotrophum]|uniref:ComF family protein n=1 Tax=Flavobacterium psychrotrophum TaxID=2294119 RepID=UPI000E312E2E|nr:ComF family protein [Flavobacterium psychrotrophum]